MAKNSVKNIKNWFLEKVRDGDGEPYFLDNYQIKAVIDEHKNTIVVARAGSGKTRTIVAKIVYLLAYLKIDPEEILVFTFNSDAAKEVNQRLKSITCEGRPILTKHVKIATTFHAFAYKVCGGGNELAEAILTDQNRSRIILEAYNRANQTNYLFADLSSRNILQVAGSFIDRAEQKFMDDYGVLYKKIIKLEDENLKNVALKLFQTLMLYEKILDEKQQIDFSRMIHRATEIIKKSEPGVELLLRYKYIFIDEYQDFSQLFMDLILNMRKLLQDTKLFVVGDDWQAINRFAGSDVEYFTNFQQYFSEDYNLIRIPSNYRSGKLVIKNANLFMGEALNDYNGSVAKSRLKGRLSCVDVKSINIDASTNDKPEVYLKYLKAVTDIMRSYPRMSIKLLARNNNLAFCKMSLQRFYEECLFSLQELNTEDLRKRISYSTVHKSKGLEADVVILLECTAGVFPSRNHSNPLFELFGDSDSKCFEDEVRLFYVALTRAKQSLYLLSTTVPKGKQKDGDVNFLNYLDMELFEEYDSGFT